MLDTAIREREKRDRELGDLNHSLVDWMCRRQTAAVKDRIRVIQAQIRRRREQLRDEVERDEALRTRTQEGTS